jgi:xanthine dehydrogenase iron-sulfur cluster and FAD-binding subunit A
MVISRSRVALVAVQLDDQDRDGDAVRSCLMFAIQADGMEVRTVEGIASPDGTLSPVQAALRECHGLQCGFCTPGFVMSLTALLRDIPPTTRYARACPGTFAGAPGTRASSPRHIGPPRR